MGTAVAVQEVKSATGELPTGCGMAGLLETLTRPWMLHIIWLLSTHGPMRFGALRRGAEGISARVLTVRLRTLEEKGFVRREVRNTNPPEVTYIPTSQIRDMQKVMEMLHSFSEKWRGKTSAN